MDRRSLQNKTLTPSEAAALFWYVFDGESDWKKVYMAAAGWTEEEAQADPVRLGQYVSKWKGTNKFKVEMARLKLVKDNFVKQIQQQAYEEGRRSAFKESAAGTKEEIDLMARGLVDYTDPQRQKEKLNEIINEARDSGEALDALKVIIQGQKNDQDAARLNKVQRFYTPMRCHECPLYEEAQKRLGIKVKKPKIGITGKPIEKKTVDAQKKKPGRPPKKKEDKPVKKEVKKKTVPLAPKKK